MFILVFVLAQDNPLSADLFEDSTFVDLNDRCKNNFNIQVF